MLESSLDKALSIPKDFNDEQVGEVEIEENLVVQDILQVVESMNLEVDENDLNELMEEHNQELSNEALKELVWNKDSSVNTELSESSCSSDDVSEAITATEIKETLEMWEKVQAAAIKLNTNKAEASRAASIFNDVAMEWFRTAKKKETEANYLR